MKASRLLGVDDDYMRRRGYDEEKVRLARVQFNSAFNEILTLWNNNLRFASEARLKVLLAKIGRLAKVKGDPLKKNALGLLRASETVVDRGIILWISRTK